MQPRSGNYQSQYKEKLSDIRYMNRKSQCYQYDIEKALETWCSLNTEQQEQDWDAQESSANTPTDKQILSRISVVYPKKYRVSEIQQERQGNKYSQTPIKNDFWQRKELQEFGQNNALKSSDFENQVQEKTTQDQKNDFSKFKLQIQKENSKNKDPQQQASLKRSIYISKKRDQKMLIPQLILEKEIQDQEKYGNESPFSQDRRNKYNGYISARSQQTNTPEQISSNKEESALQHNLPKSISQNLPSLNERYLPIKQIQKNPFQVYTSRNSSRQSLINIQTQKKLIFNNNSRKNNCASSEPSPTLNIQKMPPDLPQINQDNNMFSQFQSFSPIQVKKNEAIIQQFKLPYNKKIILLNQLT